MGTRNIVKVIGILIMTCTCIRVDAEMNTANGSDVFAKYFYSAKNVAETYPREKIHLHLDNTSYYQGDTIWYKAYVIKETTGLPSHISKPLYVEVLDQTGNVVDRQIIKLTNGEGNGQIALNNSFFTGYFEIRAFTKWMVGFAGSSYFSRVVPVYNKWRDGEERTIATYYMDKSMKQRPVEKLPGFKVAFYPEGGRLVKGIPSMVAFEAESEDSGLVDVDGFIAYKKTDSGIRISTLHDGMGSFQFTPSDKQAEATMNYHGKEYTFPLPDALDSGFVTHVNVIDSIVNVSVTRSSETLTTSTAVFFVARGIPIFYKVVDFDGGLMKKFRINTALLAGGVNHVLLINERGETLCDRPFFIYPHNSLTIESSFDKKIYLPYEKIRCTVKVEDEKRQPISGTRLSVALCNDMLSEHRDNNHNIETDLLFTSDLKGYINRPGFYFAERSHARQRMLDNLVLIRGWWQYGDGVMMDKPKYMPEHELRLTGYIKSFFGRRRKNIGLTFLLQKDNKNYMGDAVADSAGHFSIPIDNLQGTYKSLIQTRKLGKAENAWSDVGLFRYFSPILRPYDYEELHPSWDTDPNIINDIAAADSDYYKSQTENSILLHELTVKGKRKGKISDRIASFSRDLIGYYDVRQFLDEERDKGHDFFDLEDLLPKLNRNIFSVDSNSMAETVNNEVDSSIPMNYFYANIPIRFYVNGKKMEQHLFEKAINSMRTICLYHDDLGSTSRIWDVDSNFVVKRKDINWDDNMADNATSVNGIHSTVVCSITTDPEWDTEHIYEASKGIRVTYIQGYNTPAAFYAPKYDKTIQHDDNRRTLYWNPDMETDAVGKAIIECYNSSKTSSVTVDAETIDGGNVKAINGKSR